jgi:hypothetical protein
MSRWIQALLALALGLIFGLFYGWKIAPVEYVDLAPNTLAPKYQAEYILMVAEAYQGEKDLNQAARRLARLGSASPAEIITQGLETYPYTAAETALLEKLLKEIRAWQPPQNNATP